MSSVLSICLEKPFSIKNIWPVVFIILFVTLGFYTSVLADPSLHRLKKLYVSVSISDPSFQIVNITKAYIHSRVEEKLSGTGISIIKNKPSDVLPELFIELRGAKSKNRRDPTFFYYLSINIREKVFLKRNKSTEVNATTWSLVFYGKKLPDDILRELDRGLSIFVQGHTSANPP